MTTSHLDGFMFNPFPYEQNVLGNGTNPVRSSLQEHVIYVKFQHSLSLSHNTSILSSSKILSMWDWHGNNVASLPLGKRMVPYNIKLYFHY